jgi:outer membrane receptor protein involved in Fe transport
VPGGFRYNFENDEESRALFAQATYELIDNLKATAGYRETWEDINFRYVDDGSVPEDAHQMAGVPLPPILSEREPSWTLGLDYQLTPVTLLYVAQRGGFRVGGFNGTSIVQTSTGATNVDSFKPEIARDLELGIKYAGRLGKFPVRINADVYEERVRDAQRVVYAGVASFTVNADIRMAAPISRRSMQSRAPSTTARLFWDPTAMHQETRAPSICASPMICRTPWANWWCARTSTRRAIFTIRTLLGV